MHERKALWDFLGLVSVISPYSKNYQKPKECKEYKHYYPLELTGDTAGGSTFDSLTKREIHEFHKVQKTVIWEQYPLMVGDERKYQVFNFPKFCGWVDCNLWVGKDRPKSYGPLHDPRGSYSWVKEWRVWSLDNDGAVVDVCDEDWT